MLFDWKCHKRNNVFLHILIRKSKKLFLSSFFETVVKVVVEILKSFANFSTHVPY